MSAGGVVPGVMAEQARRNAEFVELQSWRINRKVATIVAKKRQLEFTANRRLVTKSNRELNKWPLVRHLSFVAIAT